MGLGEELTVMKFSGGNPTRNFAVKKGPLWKSDCKNDALKK